MLAKNGATRHANPENLKHRNDEGSLPALGQTWACENENASLVGL